MNQKERRFRSSFANRHQAAPCRFSWGGSNDIGEALDGGGPEESCQRQLLVQHFFDFDKQLYGKQGMASQVEKMVVNSHPLAPQYLLPDARQLEFDFISRWRVSILCPQINQVRF